jgi:hypothetical protein
VSGDPDVVDGNRPVFRAIETGLTREQNVEVLANLESGVKIVGRGATILEEGDRINVAVPSGNEKPTPDHSGSPAEKGARSAQQSAEKRQSTE